MEFVFWHECIGHSAITVVTQQLCIYSCLFLYTHTHIYIYIYIYIYTCMYIYIYIYIYIWGTPPPMDLRFCGWVNPTAGEQ